MNEFVSWNTVKNNLAVTEIPVITAGTESKLKFRTGSFSDKKGNIKLKGNRSNLNAKPAVISKTDINSVKAL